MADSSKKRRGKPSAKRTKTNGTKPVARARSKSQPSKSQELVKAGVDDDVVAGDVTAQTRPETAAKLLEPEPPTVDGTVLERLMRVESFRAKVISRLIKKLR